MSTGLRGAIFTGSRGAMFTGHSGAMFTGHSGAISTLLEVFEVRGAIFAGP